MTTMTVEERLTKLERSCRRWRTACVVLLLCGGAALATGAQPAPPPARPAAPAEIIQARRFELIDPHGQPAIVMQARDEGASLAVWGPDRQFATVLVSQPKKAALMLMKGTDAPEVIVEAAEQGGQVRLLDGRPPAEAAALNISGSPSGFGIFHIVNGRRESLLNFSQAGGGLELRTPGSKAVTRVVGSEAGGRIQIVDAQGKVVWESPVGK